MFGFLLNFIYSLVLVLITPRLLYAVFRYGKYRDGWAQKIGGCVPRRSGTESCIWLHAVSVGEVNVLATLIDPIKQAFPQHELVVSSTTKTGFELAKQRFDGHLVFYCPLDFTWAVSRALSRIRPTLLVLCELELWPNLLRAAQSRGVRVAVINGRLSDASYRGYRFCRPALTRLFASLDLVAVQTDDYANRFVALGVLPENVHVTGSIKFDGVVTDRNNAKTRHLAHIAGICPNDQVFIAGSTQEGEESLALDVFQQLGEEFPRLKLLLVPRHPERFEQVARLLNSRQVNCLRRSTITKPLSESCRVILVDSVGELESWWGIADIAYVGGSMGKRGGQNMIEPAAYGAAVCFGPDTSNFRDVVALLLGASAAVVVQDVGELTAFVRCCLSNSEYPEQLGQRARQLVSNQNGASHRTIGLLADLLAFADHSASSTVGLRPLAAEFRKKSA